MTLRVALLLGLVLHKTVWEVLKRKHAGVGRTGTADRRTLPVKAVKVATLAGLLIQTLRRDLFPITRRPAVLRVVGGVLYAAGLLTALIGRLHLGSSWTDLEDARVTPDQPLVVGGIYRYIRHPIYAGDLLLLVGLQLALNSWLVVAVAVPAGVVVRRAAAEESLLERNFAAYASYRARTKRFVPFVV